MSAEITSDWRRRSRAALLVLALGAAAACRREPSAAEKTAPVGAAPSASLTAPAARAETVETADTAARNRRAPGGRPAVIWLGLDGLDWDLLDRLAADGRMPNWKRLTAQGYSARLTSVMPILSPIVWTTIATGVSPDVHRVLDFQEVDPVSGQKLPISGLSRAVPAIWNVASASGVSVGVVGWWATHPAEEVSGFFVSDRVSPIMFEGIPRTGAVFPSSLAPGVEQVIARESAMSDGELTRFLDVSEAEIRGSRQGGRLDNPYVALPRIVGSTRVYQRIARDLYDKNLPDLMIVYFEGTDAIGHVFASYVPPKMSCVSDEDFRRFHRVVDEYYALVDRMLGQWMRRADEDGATLIVNSDHGFKWGSDRSCERSSLNPTTAAFWHRIDGVFAAYGTRVKASGERGTASVLDVAPTIAALEGLPIDRRETGTVVRSAFTGLAAPAARKDLFGSVTVRRVAAEAVSEKDASEYAKGLRALGYLSGGEPEKLTASGGASDRPGVTEGGFNNLGVYLRENTKDSRGAEAAFEKALALRPTYASPQFNLAVLYRSRGDDRKAVDWLFRGLAAGHADPEGTIVRWATEYRASGKKGPSGEVLERGRKAYPASEPVARELGLFRFQARDCPGAWDAVSAFEATTRSPDTLNALGLFQTCLGRRDAALALFHKSLDIQPDQPAVVQSIRLIEKAPPSAN